MKIQFPKNINNNIQTAVSLYKIYKGLVFVSVLWISFLVLPEKVWSDVRYEMNPGKVATAETRMWQAYYANDHIALRQELTNLLRNQFGISASDADEIGELLAIAAIKFESAASNYQTLVLPDLELAYARLKEKLDVEFDPKEAAGAELGWWVARRTPGSDSAEEVGRLIAHLYVVLFGEKQPAFERAGLLRAQAAHIRDEGGAACNWDTVEQRLHESYLALQEGLALVSVSYSGQVALSWDPNTENNVVGYRIYYGDSSGNYGSNVDVGNRTSYTIKDMEIGKTYYFVVTAYNTGGIESGNSAEVSHKATVCTTLPSLPLEPAKENVEKRGLQQIDISQQNIEVSWLPCGVDLTKHTKGPFTVKVMVEGITEQMSPPIFPRIIYYIGTGISYGYFDMIHEGDGVWGFDIPDPKWNRYRSNSLHYHVKVFDEEGNAISETRWEIELIDSFVRQN
ncbi:MAG: fibronectin type III domain-containing protein [Candidatus Scalindua sp.]|nr:fibronectin type III domain-containing protein [Candidatus Scalindua sp.]